MIILGVFLLGAVVGGGLGFAWMRAQSGRRWCGSRRFRFQSDIVFYKIASMARGVKHWCRPADPAAVLIWRKSSDTQARKLQDVGAQYSDVAPLKERIQNLRKVTVYLSKRIVNDLASKVRTYCKLNQQMRSGRETSQALKGDSKAQGNWGEIVLERFRAVRLAGAKSIRFRPRLGRLTDSGKRLRPDVIINLRKENTSSWIQSFVDRVRACVPFGD